MPINNPITEILAQYPAIVLDGAMATQLEASGHNLNDPLWSAKMLLEDPLAIYKVHYDYFSAGADCATTCSYQASVEGFARKGLSTQDAQALIEKSVFLAQQARADFWAKEKPEGRPYPFIAASIGPYGAFLADGSEYRGHYQVGNSALAEFHRPRMAWLLEAGADLLACETLPSMPEIEVLASLLQEHPNTSAWFSFSIKDPEHLCDGTPLATCLNLLNAQPQVAAIGINCTSIENASAAITVLHSLTDKPILVYPNSGEIYDPTTKTWHGPTCGHTSFEELAHRWLNAGAQLIGGCCRTTPKDIHLIAQAIRNNT